MKLLEKKKFFFICLLELMQLHQIIILWGKTQFNKNINNNNNNNNNIIKNDAKMHQNTI